MNSWHRSTLVHHDKTLSVTLQITYIAGLPKFTTSCNIIWSWPAYELCMNAIESSAKTMIFRLFTQIIWKNVLVFIHHVLKKGTKNNDSILLSKKVESKWVVKAWRFITVKLKTCVGGNEQTIIEVILEVLLFFAWSSQKFIEARNQRRRW